MRCGWWVWAVRIVFVRVRSGSFRAGPKTATTSRAGRSRCARWGSGCRRRALPQEYENVDHRVDDLGGGQVAHTVPMMARSRPAHKRSSGRPSGPAAAPPPPALVDWPEWLPREVVPAARPRTVLVSYERADALMADAIVDVLRRAGHLVWIDRSMGGDGWGGRLLDTVWTCDVDVFVVSPAVVGSERVAREVHLAGAERTPVVPVVLATTELPDDLAHYLDLPGADRPATRPGRGPASPRRRGERHPPQAGRPSPPGHRRRRRRWRCSWRRPGSGPACCWAEPP